ncbi:glycosyltransferase family 4 protein [uncultured Winogradskyella sp.]|uniref:glycosyltransferase family 4 protein n=1 Tax=uncultured Winogradskyella sp. TaxID=395353 RepID=UPI0026331C3F|nr:glycosyltransferase family 4 protein [uncultured Winogradskyella sp.]
MKIGLVLPATPRYSETFFVNKIKGLQDNGYSVALFVQTVRPNFNLCPVYKTPQVHKNKLVLVFNLLWTVVTLFPHIKKVLKFYRLSKLSKQQSSDILKQIFLNSHILKKHLDWLHFGFATQAIGSELIAKAINAKMAVSLRGFDINIYPKKHKNCYTLLWENIDKVHSISKYLYSEALRLGLPKNIPYSIIAPAVDINKIKAITESSHIKQNKNLKLCSVARLNWIKGLTTGIKTIAILKEVYADIEFHIIGDGNTKERERYLFLVMQLGLEDNVFFHYKLEHKQTLELIASSDLYIQTSINEGFCNAVIEAQALGKLCVATNVGGLKENIIDGKTGWLVPKQNPQEVSRKIRYVLELDNKEKTEVSQNALKRVKNEFNLENQRKQFIDFYCDRVSSF